MDSEDKKKALSERETMQKLCLNRKKQNFDALKQWDQIRAHKLITHRKVADEIDDALQTRVAESDEFLRVVMQFLSDKETQQKKYESQGLTNPQNKLQSNSISRNIHITTSECLTRLYKSTQNFKSFKKLKIILEEGVKNIQKMLTESERDIMEIRTRIELKAVEIQNENGLTIEKCDEVVAAYQKEGAVKLFTAQSDLFYLQQQFLQQSISQTKTQQSLGQAVVQFLKCVQKYEKQRLELVRETLEKYLSCLLEIGEDNQGIKSMLDILEKRTQDEIIHNFYSSESFLSKQMMKDIIKAQCKDDNFKIDLNTILNFLTRITYHPFDSRNLVLKQYKTYIKNEDQLQNSYLMVTVDAFLHVYHYKDQFELLEAKPLYTLRCTNGLDMKREGDINLHIKAKKWPINLSKQSGENISIVFLSEDQREEFVQFVGKIVI